MARFTEGELEVMQALWGRGEMKPAEIQSVFPRPIGDMALRSVLRVLVEKGHVKRRKVGKAFFYRAAASREKAMKGMMRRMAEAFAGGSPFALIAQLIRSENLSKEHIEELRRIAAEKSGEQGDRKGGDGQ